ncbi:hypothetical protein [Micromonospora sp. CPCC 205558]|uniref:hypothetical protein n=1 Tax=Micromonospora sp. CPCC 205558 TaxID=3122403 RepID=UPI002FEF04DA
MTAHGPVLPLWLCEACDRPWPCATRRVQLLGEYATSPVALRIYLASRLTAAAQDMSWASADTLDRRFLGWLA